MNRIITFFLLSFFVSTGCFAFDFASSIGAKSAGVSGASVAMKDIWAGYNNQAGIAEIDQITIAAYNESRFNVNLGSKSLAVAVPTETGNFGIVFNNFGGLGASLQKYGLAYGKLLYPNFSVGIGLDYYNITLTPEYGSDGTFTFELGFISSPVSNLSIGAHIFNPIKVKYQSQQEDALPAILRTGLNYYIVEPVSLLLEIEKNLDDQPNIKAGIDYHFHENMFIRFGGASNPYQYSFGFGVDVFNIQTDIAFNYIDPIGSISHISLSYSF